MNKTPFPLSYSQRFMDDVGDVEEWIETKSTTAGQKFVGELHALIHSRIAKYPESFMEYPWKRTAQKLYRRAIFKKSWYIIFKFDGKQIELLAFYHSKRDPSKLEL